MKKSLIIFIAMNAVAVAVLGGSIYLAQAGSLGPEHRLYRTQRSVEQLWLHYSGDRLGYAVQLVERRLNDLVCADRTAQPVAAEALHKSVVDAARTLKDPAVRRTPAEHETLQRTLLHVDILTAELLNREDISPIHPTLVAIRNRVASLKIAKPESPAPQKISANNVKQAVGVPFLDETVDHSLFSVARVHNALGCKSCHPLGKYSDTPANCAACHIAPATGPYPNHFPGQCPDCHTGNRWLPAQFDHSFAVECDSCHPGENLTTKLAFAKSKIKLFVSQPVLSNYQLSAPTVDHLTVGNCEHCHLGIAEPVTDTVIQHSAENDCDRCHPPPTAHYAQECTLCHTVSAWSEMVYRHAPTDRCRDCHTGDSPPNHVMPANSDSPARWAAVRNVGQPSAGGPETVFGLKQAGDCKSCHASSESWASTKFSHSELANCQACHPPPDEHFAGQCSSCHTSSNWLAVKVDHAGLGECEGCHPPTANHYAGSCRLCHTTDTWGQVWFNHNGIFYCAECHRDEMPEAHYAGDCTSCHRTTAWLPITFSHIGYADCKSCHSREDHNSRQCSACHTVVSWEFGHNDTNRCSECHASAISATHFDGECADCHQTSSWATTLFDHDDSDCASCHSAESSSNHYVSQCSNCHGTTSWQQTNVDHQTFTDCQLCHIPPAEHWPNQCSTCHTTDNWGSIIFDHAEFTDCLVCHAPPEGHWPGQCSDCHTTVDWNDINFDHTTYTNCKACHGQERPAGHPRGQCSKCHTTASWAVPPTPTPVPADDDPDSETVSIEAGQPETTSTPTPTATSTPVPESTPTDPTEN